jgi:DNA (cytosine-5)-methyltransferase 1
MRILNLYSGLGGNRALWTEHEIVAVEDDRAIARAYHERFPDDSVVIADAHEYLLNEFERFDFIWSSPPCQSHGQYRHNVGVIGKGFKPLFPDMKLYEEIIFLKHHFAGKFVVENTKPYYEPLVAPTAVLARHLFWANFEIPPKEFPTKHIRSKNKIQDYADLGFDTTGIANKRQALRNCVDSNLGNYILSCLELPREGPDAQEGVKK